MKYETRKRLNEAAKAAESATYPGLPLDESNVIYCASCKKIRPLCDKENFNCLV